MEAQYGGTRLGRQELEGELIADPAGAMFTRETIEKGRAAPEEALGLERIVVAVDPAAGSGPDNAACGIVAAGVKDGVVFVLRDATARGLRPKEWAERTVALARSVGAGAIVAEANQGGEMVKQVLELAGSREQARVVLRHARESKKDRAQPVSMLYDQGRVRHVGVLKELEGEMCAFGAEGEGGLGGGRSPDRVDALVWAVTELTEKRVRPRVEALW
jgi:phage terminase large subunit-like protein